MILKTVNKDNDFPVNWFNSGLEIGCTFFTREEIKRFLSARNRAKRDGQIRTSVCRDYKTQEFRIRNYPDGAVSALGNKFSARQINKLIKNLK